MNRLFLLPHTEHSSISRLGKKLLSENFDLIKCRFFLVFEAICATFQNRTLGFKQFSNYICGMEK